jgi:hypothetical protein
VSGQTTSSFLRLRLGTVAVGCHSPLVPLSSLHAALGAVFIAAVGVWGVFKISFWVASETGRSLNAEKQAAVAAPAAPPAAGSPDGAAAAQRQAGTAPAGDVKAASPLEAWRPGGGAQACVCEPCLRRSHVMTGCSSCGGHAAVSSAPAGAQLAPSFAAAAAFARAARGAGMGAWACRRWQA